MMSKFASSAAVAALLAASCFAGPASAAVTLFFGPPNTSTENTGASVEALFDFVDAGGDVQLNLSISNITDGSLGLHATEATLVGLAFDLPTYVSLTYNSDGGFTKLWNGATLQPYGGFDVGISPPRNSFNGGNPQNGLTAGGTLNVSFLINTTSNAATFESQFLNGFNSGDLRAAARFQQVNAGGGSDKVLGTVSAVPEPSTWALMITGFGLAGAALRRRRLAPEAGRA
jgi:hypothetical protein